MALELVGQIYNANLLAQYNQLEAATNSFGELAILTNDVNHVTDVINESLMLMQDLLEDTLIMDPDIEITLCPDYEAAENTRESETINVLSAVIEINPDDKALRAIMGEYYITDWIEYDPAEDASNDLQIAQAFRLLAESIERRFNLSQIKEEPPQ
jgi:hypothetical protein